MSGVRPQADEPFVGRAWEAAEIDAAIARAHDQRGELVLIGGEAGIGKTRLARQALTGAPPATVVWASCWEGDDGPPYWPWMQVVRALLGVVDADGEQPMRVDRTALSLLAAGASADPDWSLHADAAAARARLFDAVVGLLAAAGSGGAVVVVLDDLHRADEPSLLLLRHVGTQIHSLPTLIIGTYRDADVRIDQARSALLASIERTARSIRLGGLGHTDLAQFVLEATGDHAPTAWLDALARRTGGNPFFVKQILRLLAARGGGVGDSLALVPTSVIDIVAQRVARLPLQISEILETAAVIGETFVLEDVVRLGFSAVSLEDAMDVAARAGLIEPAARGFRFVHALAREALYENLGPARRARLHQRVGLAIESDNGPPETLAHHFAAAAPVGETERALRYTLDAGEAALARLAHEDARDWFEQALALAASRDDELALRALLGRAEVRRRAGDPEGARADLQTVIGAARRRGAASLIARAALGVQRLGFTSGQVHHEPTELLEEAAGALGDDDPELRALVLSALATELWEHALDRVSEARAASSEALELATKAGSPTTLARCLEARYTTLWAPDDVEERASVAARMVQVARRSGDEELPATAQLLYATARLELGDPQWHATLEQFFALGESLRLPRVDYLVATRRAAVALLHGRHDEATVLIEEAAALGERIAEPDAAPVEFYLRWELARATGTRAHLLDARRPKPRAVAVSLAGSVWTPLMLLDAGRHQDARRAFEVAAAVPLDRVRRDWIFLANVADLAEAAIRLRDGDVAKRCYDTLLPYAGRMGVVAGAVCFTGAVDHHLGALALALGHNECAVEHLRSAVAAHELLDARSWAGASRELLDQASSATSTAIGTLTHTGKIWRVTWQGRESHLPSAKGIGDLAVLLARPGQEVHSAELYGGAADSRGDAAIDETARRAYRARLAELDRDLADAQADNDIGRAERLELERDALIDHLRSQFDLKGRARRVGDTSERARKAVRARVRDAIGIIEDADPGLGAHLRASVHTGTFCSYQPAEPAAWNVR